MSHSLFIAFVMFAAVMFFTPGPNNIMLLSSGLTYGFRPTIPHIVGITIGFAFMVGAVGLGLGIVSAAQRRLSMRGLLHLLWDRAGFSRWSPRMEGKLVHYQYDTFRTELTDTKLEKSVASSRPSKYPRCRPRIDA